MITPADRTTTASRNVPWRAASVVCSPTTAMPRCRSQATVAGWVLERLPVATTSAPPRCRARSIAAVLGSRWMDAPSTSPAKGRVRSISSAVAASRRQLPTTQSMRVVVTAQR